MNETVLIALIGVLGTLFAAITSQAIELRKTRLHFDLEDLKERKRLQRTWFREQNLEKYNKLKDWIIDAIRIAEKKQQGYYYDDGPVYKLSNEDAETETKLLALRAEVKAIASTDEQLLKCLYEFFTAYDHVRTRETYQHGTIVINKIFELIAQLPALAEDSEVISEKTQNELQKVHKIRLVLFGTVLIVVIITGYWVLQGYSW